MSVSRSASQDSEMFFVGTSIGLVLLGFLLTSSANEGFIGAAWIYPGVVTGLCGSFVALGFAFYAFVCSIESRLRGKTIKNIATRDVTSASPVESKYAPCIPDSVTEEKVLEHISDAEKLLEETTKLLKEFNF